MYFSNPAVARKIYVTIYAMRTAPADTNFIKNCSRLISIGSSSYPILSRFAPFGLTPPECVFTMIPSLRSNDTYVHYIRINVNETSLFVSDASFRPYIAFLHRCTPVK